MIILIGGPSAAGKTSLSKILSKKFDIPVLCKDKLKEILFDTLGAKNYEQTNKYRESSWSLFYHVIEIFCSGNHDVILEANFKSAIDSKKMKELISKYSVNVVQITCTANAEILVKRFFDRGNKDRHPGHNTSSVNINNLLTGISKETESLNIGAPTLRIDMNYPDSLDHEVLFKDIANYMKQ